MSSFDLFGNRTTPSSVLESNPEDPLSYRTPLAGTGDDLSEEVRTQRPFYGLSVVGIIITVLLAAQCYNLQVSNAAINQARADRNSLRLIHVPASRGLIVDSSGAILAQNSSQLVLAIDPQTLPASLVNRKPIYALLQQKAGIDAATIAAIEDKRKKTPDPFVIKPNLSKEDSILYKEWFAETPGVQVLEEPSRLYASMASLGHLVGYVGQPDASSAAGTSDQPAGKAGLEEQYNDSLSGTPGVEQAEVNAQGQIVRILSTAQSSQPLPGKTLKLNIDSRLQTIVANALADEISRRTAKYGPTPQFGASAVVMNPNTGAILAMVSLPDYNDQLFADGINQADYQNILNNPGNPLLNRATQGVFAPGSTIKPFVAAAGLQAGVISANTQMVTPDAIYVGNFRFPDWETHGQTDTRKSIAQSNDIFFYAVGGGWAQGGIPNGLGIDRENQYLRDFGFGSDTGIDLPSESSGLIADNAWKQAHLKQSWYIGDTYHASIGQGFTLTTPLQLTAATASLVNGGTLYKPQLAQSLTDTKTGQVQTFAPQITRSGFISPQNAQVVREGMRETVTGGVGWKGSGWPLNTLGVTSAGKTGSAQFGPNNQYEEAWYTGFAPYENPQIAFSVLIEAGGESFYSSVPVAEEILRGYFNEPLAPGQHLNADTQVPSGYQGEH